MEDNLYTWLLNSVKHIPIKLIDYDKTTRKLTLTHPGLSYSAFDSDGNPSISNIMWLFQTTFIKHLTPDCLGSNELWLFDVLELTGQRNRALFITSFHIAVRKEMYDTALAKRDLVLEMSPFEKVENGFTILMEIYTTEKEHHLISFLVSFALMDESRNMARVPADLSANLPVKDKSLRSRVRRFLKPVSRPTFHHKESVRYDQIDHNGHMNFASFYDHAREAVMQALLGSDKVIKSLTMKEATFGLRRLDIVYLNECHLNDPLDLFVWEEDSSKFPIIDAVLKINDEPQRNPNDADPLVMCMMEKDRKPVCQVSMQFIKNA